MPKQTIKKSSELRKEAQMTNIEYIKFDEHNRTLDIKFDRDIHPYIRHRVSGFRVYDPLSAYKGIIVKKINTELSKPENSHILETINEWTKKKCAIAEDLEIGILPPKSFSMVKLAHIFENHGKILKTTKPDFDNYNKTINDIITMFWFDDGEIAMNHTAKYYADENYTIVHLEYDDEDFSADRFVKSEHSEELYNFIKNYKSVKNTGEI